MIIIIIPTLVFSEIATNFGGCIEFTFRNKVSKGGTDVIGKSSNTGSKFTFLRNIHNQK